VTAVLDKTSAATVPTRFVEVDGRRLAYRSIGSGPPLMLCVRLRGILDSWDPAFLDALAAHFRVITFDYSGLGQSTGASTYRRRALAKDAKDLADALGLDQVVMGGWSLGGMVAQTFTALYPERVSHTVLLGTTPPGEQAHPPEPIFFEIAVKPDNTLEDEYILFFEPASASSRAAGKASHDRIERRQGDRSPAIPEETYMRLLRETAGEKALFPDDGGYAEFFKTTSIPVLVVSGDHEIVFPVQNWFALTRQWPTLHLLTLPQTGHGPQHQFPQLCADVIASFVRNTNRP
jgi:pimeloyl-ACP methyl ester carboxylesterase